MTSTTIVASLETASTRYSGRYGDRVRGSGAQEVDADPPVEASVDRGWRIALSLKQQAVWRSELIRHAHVICRDSTRSAVRSRESPRLRPQPPAPATVSCDPTQSLTQGAA
ncbi:hypothetical protein VTN00DRAFT_2711 [Thermoascus crustaceus]|uniref:uncharacterized protein n=1 Tax=Thermoascus crustaceus TaxID=5088 RepID=UPI003743D1AA